MDSNIRGEMQLFIAEAESSLEQVAKSFNWEETDTTLTSRTVFNYCPINKEHRVPESKMDQHILKCQLKSLGYSPNDAFLEPIESHLLNHPSVVQIDKYKQQDILCQALKKNRNLDIRTHLREPPLTFDRYLYEFSQDERYALYDYAIQQTSYQHDSQIILADPLALGSNAPGLNKSSKEGGSRQTLHDLLAEERNAKRRRVAYRKKNPDASGRKSDTETLRELIQSQMDFFYSSSNQDGGPESKEKPTEQAVQWRFGRRLNIHNYHRQWEVAQGLSTVREESPDTKDEIHVGLEPREKRFSPSRSSRETYLSSRGRKTYNDSYERSHKYRRESSSERDHSSATKPRSDRSREYRSPTKYSSRYRERYRRSRSRSLRKHHSDHGKSSSGRYDDRGHRKHARYSRSRSRSQGKQDSSKYLSNERRGQTSLTEKYKSSEWKNSERDLDRSRSRSYSVPRPSEAHSESSRVTAAHSATSYDSQAHTSGHDIRSARNDHYSENNETALDSLLPQLYQKRFESVAENISPEKLEPREYLELKRKLLPLLLGRESNSTSSSESSQETKSYSKHKKKKSKRKKKKKSSK